MRALLSLSWFVAHILSFAALAACGLAWLLGRQKKGDDAFVYAGVFFVLAAFVGSQFLRSLIFFDRTRPASKGALIWAALEIGTICLTSTCFFFWLIGICRKIRRMFSKRVRESE